MESTRQKKISRQLQKDLSEIFQLEGRTLFNTSFVSVTVVRVSPDLSVARAYLSVFGLEKKEELLAEINHMAYYIRKKLAARVRNQMRKVPDLKFFLDDSVDYAQNIESLLND
ncbi:MAG: ribosome-binding factor A [Flavobacteriales bacterium]|nr:ribosome-binding factor A [Flavobacteriales bacterium]